MVQKDRFILSCDVETYSDIDLAEAGVHRYVESPAFDILLVAYAFGDSDVHVIDLAVDGYPGKDECDRAFWKALTDPRVEKHAFNASFERNCFAKYLGKEIPPEQWVCTRVKALTLGLPGSLEAVGEAMGLKKDELKDKQGKALIQYFCKPCKPTRTNGQRTRNLPQHDPEKWELFKEYNRQDVVAERAIAKKLDSIEKTTEKEQRLWELDQHMNDNGVRVDVDMVEKIVDYDNRRGEELMEEAKELTGLENPNSIAQLKDWLNDQGVPFTQVTKETIGAALKLKYLSDNVRRVLEIRQALGKASVKKYQAMLNAVCEDGRLRGILQFYGANRSGRWAGRLVQTHNLAKNSLPDLELARSLAADGDFETMQTLFGETAFVFSELVRTAFIASEGRRFVVSDFSAIEARVLAWLADEQWVLDAFRDGKDIYCETASMMYKVPVVKHGENGHLRGKGKVAVLACIAEGQKVLTDAGLVPIERVTLGMKVWDGVEWVNHDGVISKGKRKVIKYGGLEATEDHIVWAEIEGQNRTIQFGEAARSGAHLTKSGAGGVAVRLAENNQPGEKIHEGMEPVHGTDAVHRVRPEAVDISGKHDERQDERLPELQSEEGCPKMDRQTDDGSEATVREPERRAIQELRSEGHQVRVPQRDGCVPLHGRKLRNTGQSDGDRQDQRQRQLCSGEPSVGGQEDELREQTHHSAERVRSELLAVCRDDGQAKTVGRDEQAGDHQRGDHGSGAEAERLETHPRKVRVYDIRLAGPRNRFTVSDILVHNCGYQGGIGAMRAMDRGGSIPDDELQAVVDAWRLANPRIVKLWYDYERAAKIAIQERRTVKRTHGVEFSFHDGNLFIKLPGGRKLCYWNARVKMNPENGRESIVYMGVNQETKRWGEAETYGGKLVENVTQAVARDCLAEAMMRVAAEGYEIVMHVHDEMIVDVPDEDKDAAEEITRLMSVTPDWAPGLPLKGETYETEFYKKD